MALETNAPTSLAGFDDTDLQHRVQLYLESRQTPEFRDLTVEVDNGVVCLSGTIENVLDRDKALNICRRVAGVIQLVDGIRIGEAHRPAPARLSPR